MNVDLWTAVAAALAILVLAGLGLWGHLWFWTRRIALRLDYALVERLATADGGQIELRRVTAVDGSSGGTPVLLVHGICANHRNQDIHPRYSLARFLAHAGRDVWLLRLRSGMPLGLRRRYPMSFAAMARYDVPFAVERVLAHTGASKLDYVGFSMGGMLLYAALGRYLPAERIHRAVFVGSPGRIDTPYPVPAVLRFLPRSLVPRLPTRFGARTFAFLSEWFTTPIHRMVVNPANVAAGITRVALIDCIEDVPGPLLADFLSWATTDGEVRVHGQSILSGLATIDVPALFVAGSADRIGPVASVRVAFEAWGRQLPAPQKSFAVLGRDYGAKNDYAHGDLAVGAHVGVELYEPIARFLGHEALPAGVRAAQAVAAKAPEGVAVSVKGQ